MSTRTTSHGTPQDRRDRYARLSMSRRGRIMRYVGDTATSARERDKAAAYVLRHTTAVPDGAGGFALIYHPFAPVYDPLADTMTPPARVWPR